MVRLSRAQMQEHNRTKVLAAARAEFTERGFRDTKIDQIVASVNNGKPAAACTNSRPTQRSPSSNLQEAPARSS